MNEYKKINKFKFQVKYEMNQGIRVYASFKAVYLEQVHNKIISDVYSVGLKNWFIKYD